MDQSPLETLWVPLISTAADADRLRRLEATKDQDPDAQTAPRMAQMRDLRLTLLGRAYLENRPTERQVMGRVRNLGSGDNGWPDHAGACFVTRGAGAALWKMRIPSPARSLDPSRYVGLLDPEAEVVARRAPAAPSRLAAKARLAKHAVAVQMARSFRAVCAYGISCSGDTL